MAENSPLLSFKDSWDSLDTRDISFDSILKPSESFGLEVIRDIDSLRRSTCVKQSTIAISLDAQHIDRMEQYLRFLRDFIQQLDGDANAQLSFHWTSPLAGRGTHFYKLAGLKAEQAMAAFQYASALRALALQITQSTPARAPAGAAAAARAADDASTPTAGTWAEASTQLRKAAGVYQWLGDQWLAFVPVPPDKPAELVPAMSACMQQVCLAEAQVITAHRAAQRGTSPATTSSLFVGAADLFEAAALTLRNNAGKFSSISERLRRFLAVAAALQRARAYRHAAEDLRTNKAQAGQGGASCLEAASLLQSCLAASEVDVEWRTVIAAEQAALELTRARCEKDRETVYYQSVAKAAPPLEAGRVLVKPIPYSVVSEALEDASTGGTALKSAIANMTISERAMPLPASQGALQPGSNGPGAQQQQQHTAAGKAKWGAAVKKAKGVFGFSSGSSSKHRSNHKGAIVS